MHSFSSLKQLIFKSEGSDDEYDWVGLRAEKPPSQGLFPGLGMGPHPKFSVKALGTRFAGLRVSDSTIEPLPKYLDAIRDFPTPTSTTDIRSWFGLVNQVANYAQLRDIMEPFKPFLSPR